MATISKFRTVTEAKEAAKDDLNGRHANGESPARLYVLRVDGDTDTFEINCRGKISHSRTAGHITMGMWIDPCDLPCVIG